MKLYFICEGRFIKRGRNIYCTSGGFTNKIWNRYLQVFDSMVVIARVKEDDYAPLNESWVANDQRVSFVELPYYIGPKQYLKNRKKIQKILNSTLDHDHAYICRVPGQLGYMATKILRSRGIRYGVEVVGDPWEVFSAGAIEHPLRMPLRYNSLHALRKTAKHAHSALYVTQSTLQTRYPIMKNRPLFSASDVQITPSELPCEAKKFKKKDTYEILCCGSLEQMYKAPDIVISALNLLKTSNIKTHLTWLGDGKHKDAMHKLAADFEVSETITFAGNVPSETVHKHLENADLFVLVSRTEGLPRAIIEAMAMGLPCIGSDAGGIPELLDKQCIVSKNNPRRLAQKIQDFLSNEEFYNTQAQRNFEHSKAYYPTALETQREQFYRSLKIRKKVCFVVADPMTAVAFLRDPIEGLSSEFDISLAANMERHNEVKKLNIKHLFDVKIARKTALFNDIIAVFELYFLFKREGFDAVYSLTPKAGFLTAIAAYFARTPHRIHTFTGQVWATKKGVRRQLLKLADRVIARLDNHLLTDGNSQHKFLIYNNITTKEITVLGDGSICGVDTKRFDPSKEIRGKIRAELGIDRSKIVYIFLGRINRDKGIFELLEAFDNLSSRAPRAYLLLVGYDEENCMQKLGNYKNIIVDKNFNYFGATDQPEALLQAADIFCLPSYREGFGSSVIEASCLKIPVICSDIYGLQDAMIECVSGLRCRVKDVKSLEEAMKTLYDEPLLRKKLGLAGRRRVLEKFSSERLTKAWVDFYCSIFKQ